MRTLCRIALLTSLLAVASATAVRAAGLGIAKWEAGTCAGSMAQVKECEYTSPHSAFYTQSAGHPEWGLTGFELAHSGSGGSRLPAGEALKRIRVDIPPGLAADPQALETCTREEFTGGKCGPGTEAGFVELEAVVDLPIAGNTLLTLKGKVFNIGPQAESEGKEGLPLLFGIEVEGVEPLVENVDLYLEGHVSYAHEASLAARGVTSGDYHEWFVINNIPTEVEVLGFVKASLRTLRSKLFFNGHAGVKGKEDFLTMPSNCRAPVTSYLEVESYSGEVASAPTTPPVGVEGCDKVPFEPTAAVTPETSQYDTPDGAVTDVRVPQNEGSSEINTADIDDAEVTLPEGLTLNPSAANGLEACTQSQLARTEAAPASCPADSKIGEVNIETDLPPGSLKGDVYLGKADGTGKITGPPYLIFIDARSVYGVSVKLEGKAEPNPSTGRVRVSFAGNPQLPFSDLTLKLDGGPRAPLANPDSCAAVSTESVFTPYTEQAAFAAAAPFAIAGCPSPIPFDVGQSTAQGTTGAGAFTTFTLNLSREDAQQQLSTVQTELPAGLVGLIPSVTRCAEPAAAGGDCPASSQIGTATATAGSGGEPYGFSGPVYLTGPIGSAPYGLSIPIEAAAGPFDLGRVTTQVALTVEPHSGRVIATATLPAIQGGVPLRLRSISVQIAKPSFLFNPTYCGGLASESTLGSAAGAEDHATSPFQVSDCSSLPFQPVFTASSPTAPSRADGASLTVGYTQPAHQADIRSVVAQLPKQLPSRLTTLHKACAEATYAANPYSCSKESEVGTVTVKTPVLPEPLQGPAYLVSHGGAAFPNLDLLLEGDHGVRVILESTTDIKDGITTSTFPSIPDVPVSGFELSLPTGPHSALGSYESLCAKPLYMPITATAQNGDRFKQNVRLSIGSCKIELLSHRVKGDKLVVRVRVFTAGRVSVKSPGLHTTYRQVGGPAVVTLKAPLSKRARRTLAAGGSLHVRFRIGFNPRHSDEYHSAAYASVTFRH